METAKRKNFRKVISRVVLNVFIFQFGICSVLGQSFDFYGPQPFGEILESDFQRDWSFPTASFVQNRSYLIILDAQTRTNALVIDESGLGTVDVTSTDLISGSSYDMLLRSVFQTVDENTHEDQNPDHDDFVALSNRFRMNPFLHSYYALDANDNDGLIVSDGGSFHISEASETGYVLFQFDGTSDFTRILAVSKWDYNSSTSQFTEVTNWPTKYLKMEESSVEWTELPEEGSYFFLANPNDLIGLDIENGSAFNPLSVSYQVNETAELPEGINDILDSKLVTGLAQEIDDVYEDQLGASTSASNAASQALDEIVETLDASGESMRYSKAFYMAVRESMLSYEIESTDIYGGRIGNRTIEDVYFTNATDDSFVPHPFMVIVSHAVSTRPNQLIDVNRPPGAEEGIGYAESSVTRNGKLGEFVIKIPLKDYGLIDELLDNDLSVYGDLASDFDNNSGTTTVKDVYNYTSLASNGVAIDGVTIYPAYNNNLRFAVEDGEVTHSGIHVGGGLELHYHADGHAYSSNGIALYNLADYESHDHPPVIGIAYDGIALFGRHEENYADMTGYGTDLDEFGGHDHGDGFGYHYHAHTQMVESIQEDETIEFEQHFLLVGAWKGNINNIPGFNENKMSQFLDEDIARYAGAPFVVLSSGWQKEEMEVYPNPTEGYLTIHGSHDIQKVSFYSMEGRLLKSLNEVVLGEKISISDLPRGTYLMKVIGVKSLETKKIIIK